ncbi:VOC family protein [Cryobacterium arcticum]|uniref:Bleomycin resistance protein n=1 Tax=Cryobacterium arcticum TaxID=670052 RepID=A0A317ZNV1_9MICO|nr:VOC family protein [Cryobacterium arcticum]PXA65761.1 bleomycin resistance protein [Cryobacterium arcticum]
MARLELFPIINVTAIEPVRRFYETVFGAGVDYAFPDDGDPVYLTLRIGSSTLALGLGTTPAMYRDTPLPATGHAVDICVYVPDLETAVAAAPAAGGAVAVSPADTPWGERVAYLRDPQGTMLLVIQNS